jgi:hypothetical protein
MQAVIAYERARDKTRHSGPRAMRSIEVDDFQCML